MTHLRMTFLLALCLVPMGCAKVTTPPPPLAPGYLNQLDETLGSSLAAVNAFVNQEKVNYAALSTALQAKETAYLNTLIAATNEANNAYNQYHAGTLTEAQAQSAINSAQTAQSTLVAQKEAH